LDAKLISFPKRASEVFLNDKVYKEMVFAFWHFFGLHFSNWKSEDSRLPENATRNSEKRNAFWRPFLQLFANRVQKSSETSGFIRFCERDCALSKIVIFVMLFHHF